MICNLLLIDGIYGLLLDSYILSALPVDEGEFPFSLDPEDTPDEPIPDMNEYLSKLRGDPLHHD